MMMTTVRCCSPVEAGAGRMGGMTGGQPGGAPGRDESADWLESCVAMRIFIARLGGLWQSMMRDIVPGTRLGALDENAWRSGTAGQTLIRNHRGQRCSRFK